eukprot:COSAG05_NODE_11965_length_488_cov_62.773779_1_plen_51_part_00
MDAARTEDENAEEEEEEVGGATTEEHSGRQVHTTNSNRNSKTGCETDDID